MRRPTWRLTALYLASCFLVIDATVGSHRAAAFLRAQRMPAPEAASRSTVAAASAVPARPAVLDATAQRPRSRMYQVPAGTLLPVRLRTPVSSASARVDDQVDATLSEAVTQDGVELIPAGSLLHGAIAEVVPASRKHVRGRVTLAFAAVQHAGTQSRAAIRTFSITVEAAAPTLVPEGGKPARRQLLDLDLRPGHPLIVTLKDPLQVSIPTTTAGPASRGLLP